MLLVPVRLVLVVVVEPPALRTGETEGWLGRVVVVV